MSFRVIWQYMDRSVTQKILYGPQKLFLVTDRSIYFHMTLSAMNYLLYTMLKCCIFSPLKKISRLKPSLYTNNCFDNQLLKIPLKSLHNTLIPSTPLPKTPLLYPCNIAITTRSLLRPLYNNNKKFRFNIWFDYKTCNT